MALHNMLTQPINTIFISSPSRIRNVKIKNIEFMFVFCNIKRFWGFKKLWVTKQEKCFVSDIEKTILDCLFQPKYCGGISEIVKGIWLKRDDINYDRLLKYSQKFEKKSAIKRLGYILQILNVNERTISFLQQLSSDNSYSPLEPLIPKLGRHNSQWGLILNVNGEELRKVVKT